MKKYYGLTKTETEIMDIFWNCEKDGKKELSFKEMTEYSQTVLGKAWKMQTLNTFLTNLHKMGLLGIRAQGRKNMYYAACTREEHIHNWTKSLVKTEFENSIGKLLAAYTGGEELSDEEAEEILKIIGR